MSRPEDSTPPDFEYYFALWIANVGLFALLDIAKRVDDLLLGLSLPELVVNAFCVMPLVVLPSLLLAAVSLLLDRRGLATLVHFLAYFSFLTVNLWSIKIGMALRLSGVQPGTRAFLAYLALALVLGISAWGASRFRGRLEFLEQGKGWLWKGLLALCLLGLFALPLRPPLPGKAPSDAPNIIMVTFDTLTATHMSVYGYPRDTTPRLEELARESWVFENVHSNFTNTPPCLASIEGVLPMQVGGQMVSDERGLLSLLRPLYPYRAFFSYLTPEIYFRTPLPGSRLTRSGMDTPLYHAYRRLFRDRDLLWLGGLLSEEVSYFWPYHGDFDDDIFWQRNHFPARLSLDGALAYLKEHPRGAFVWVHLWEPHWPYLADPDLAGTFGPSFDTPPEFTNRVYPRQLAHWVDSMRNRYDETLLSVDRQFGRFLDELKAKGLYDSSFLIVSADHGESLDNGYIGHSGPSVLEAITRIPLLIHVPGNRQSKRLKVNACSLDITPTILELAGLPPAEHLPGESLLPYVKDPDRQSDRFKVSRSVDAFWGRPGDVAVYWRDFKGVFPQHVPGAPPRLYNLTDDPQATKDIAANHPEILDRIAQALKPQP